VCIFKNNIIMTKLKRYYVNIIHTTLTESLWIFTTYNRIEHKSQFSFVFPKIHRQLFLLNWVLLNSYRYNFFQLCKEATGRVSTKTYFAVRAAVEQFVRAPTDRAMVVVQWICRRCYLSRGDPSSALRPADDDYDVPTRSNWLISRTVQALLADRVIDFEFLFFAVLPVVQKSG